MFGSGFENLFWGFQTGFIGSVATGLGAMFVIDGGVSGRRAAIVVGLLLGSLTFSGIGLVMCVAVGVEWVMDPRWRGWVPALVIPAAIYLAWYLIVGRSGVALRDPLSFDMVVLAVPSVFRGLSNALGSITGAPLLGFVGAAVLATWGSREALRGELAPRVAAIAVAIGVMYVLIGATRGHLFDGVLNYTRYTYVSGILAMVALGILVGRQEVPDAGRQRLVMIGAIGCWLALALVVNVGLLVAGREVFLERADMTRALVIAALDPPEGRPIDVDRSLVLVPSPAALCRS